MSNIFDFDFIIPGLKIPRIKVACSHHHLSITGPSGTGKSSIAKAIAGIVKYDGTIKIKGQSLTGPAHLRNFAYLPQDHLLLPHLKTKDNIVYPKGSSFQPEIIETLKLEHILERMPRHLSGGEKQRVALARALSTPADLFILDEPFSSLDSVMKERAIQLVMNITREKPLLLISHNDLEVKRLNCYDFLINQTQDF